MPAIIRGSVVYNSGLSGTQQIGTLTMPGNIQANDRAFLLCMNLNNDPLSMYQTPNWVETRNQITFGACGGKLFSKQLVGDEGGSNVSYQMTLGSRTAAILVVVGDANVPEPVSTFKDDNSTPTINIADARPQSDDNLLVTMGVVRHSQIPSAGVSNYSQSWTEIQDTATTNSSGNKAGAFAATRQLGVGTSGTTVVGGTAQSNSIGAISLVYTMSFPSNDPTAVPSGWVEVRAFSRV